MKKITIRMRDEVATKVSGGLAAIEEEIREQEPRLQVKQIAPEIVFIDGWQIPCATHNKWYVAGQLLAEVIGEISEQSVDCIITAADEELFAGSIDEWWTKQYEYLQSLVRRGRN